MINQVDCVELGLTCADVCTTLGQIQNGKRSNDLSNAMYKEIEQLTT